MRPALSYFICTTPRSGSTLLADGLFSTGIAGKPQEYFEENQENLWIQRLGIKSDLDYFDKVLTQQSPNSVFSVKVFWFQLDFIARKLTRALGLAEPELGLLDCVFPNLRFVYLSRRDTVRQAISYVKAEQTGIWWSIPGVPENRTAPDQEPTFDFERIDSKVKLLTSFELSWRHFFEIRKINPLTIEYEEFARAYEPTIVSVLQYLGIALPAGMTIPPPRLVQQSDHVNEEWYERYHELKRPGATRVHPASDLCSPPARTQASIVDSGSLPAQTPTKVANPGSLLMQTPTGVGRLRPAVESTLRYFICTAPRTGSTLLADALYSTRIAGNPREYFDENHEQATYHRLGISSDREYVEKILSEITPNGVFGLKLFWLQLDSLAAKLSRAHDLAEPDFSLVDRVFPDLRFIFLYRKDKVRQAISYVKAEQTGIWWSIPGVPENRTAPDQEPTFDFERIDSKVKLLTSFELSWRHFFEIRKINPLTIEYEEFARAYEPTIVSVLQYLGIPIPAGMTINPPRLVKQSDHINEEWYIKYHQLKQSRTGRVAPIRDDTSTTAAGLEWVSRPKPVCRSALSYFICTSPRTGSNLLAEALSSTGVAGQPTEYFDAGHDKAWLERRGFASRSEYFEYVLKRLSPNGVFGLKNFPDQFEYLVRTLSGFFGLNELEFDTSNADPLHVARGLYGLTESDFDLLFHVFPNLRFVFLYRKDKVSQAISFVKADQTQIWWSIPQVKDNRSVPKREPKFNFADIERRLKWMLDLDTYWLRFFERRKIDPLTIEYEDFIQAYEPTVFSVLRYLELPIPEGLMVRNARMKKQADDTNEEWYQRYLERKRAESAGPIQ